jgi:hypothetical protein
MNPSISGFGFLSGYVVMVGVASFLEKFSMKQLNPYQVNVLTAIGMTVTALWDQAGKSHSSNQSSPVGRSTSG